MDNVNIEKQIQEAVKDLPDYNYMLGRTLMQPYKPANSGSRALMYSVHTEHLLTPLHGEVPIIQTGFETEYGKHSSSYVVSNHNYRVMNKIQKFDLSDSIYYLIVQDIDSGEYDIIERTTYKHTTETYGYLWNNSRLDHLKIGDVINSNSVIKTSTGYDEFCNKMNGVNLTTLYLSCAQNMEDSIIISESAAKKLSAPLIKTTNITINDNDILKNMYGDENVYKTFPDIGEHTKNGIFCSIRRLENENVLYSLSQARLREDMITDKDILFDGMVADIDVYCNNPEALAESFYNTQIMYYYKQKMRFYHELVDIVAPLYMRGKLSYNLQKMYATARDAIDGKQFIKDGKQFSNVIMNVTIIEVLPMRRGDKMSDRYGGKGVVSDIRPDNMMPVLDNGEVVEVIKNQSTCINRENLGQLHEQSLTFIGMRLIDFFKTGALSYKDMFNMTCEFINMVDPLQAHDMMACIDMDDDWGLKVFMDSIINDDRAIILSDLPFTTRINIDTIAEIYKKFPFIKQYELNVPMEDSNGNIRFIKARRRVVVGKIYNYRLKQYAEEKFSVTSLSSTNLKGLNTRSRASKAYEEKYKKTPIMFGAMESGDLAHLGMEYVVMNLMLYSASPQARRLFEQLLVGDPYNIDIKLDENSKNRNAEIINALLKTMGLQLRFKKIPRERKFLTKDIMCRDISPTEFNKLSKLREIMGLNNNPEDLDMRYKITLAAPKEKFLTKDILCKDVDQSELNKPSKLREILCLGDKDSDESSE